MTEPDLSGPLPTFKLPHELISEALAGTYLAWRELAGSRFAPSRKEIAPDSFKAVLDSIFLIDVIDDGADFRFVLAGERIVEFMGGRHAGKLVSKLPSSPFFERMTRLLQRCIHTKRPVAVGPIRTVRGGREYLETEVVFLPLSDNGMSVTGLMGAVHFSPARDLEWPTKISDDELTQKSA
jgi:hypothetical protein